MSKQEIFDKFIEIMGEFAQIRAVAALRDGFIMTTPFTICGSVFLLLANLPVPGYADFMASIFGTDWTAPLNAVAGGTFSVLALIVVLSITYKFVENEGCDAMMAAILAPDYPGSTIVTDSVTSDELTEFLQGELGLRHLRFKRGYKNVIDECIRLNKEGTVSPLAIETSGHGALSENYYLDDGAYLAVKLLIAAAKAKAQGRHLADLVKKLGEPVESREYRMKIMGEDDFRSYGENVLKVFEQRAAEAGSRAAKPSYEGVRLVFPDGWALLRMSLHDPQMPLNIESRKKGGVAEIAAKVQEFLQCFTSLDMSVFKD